ncbi:hypothetical protein TNCV_2390011 [Trichonephila clavipes]|nr:hypothetical protein TNCV_2390011 [Trichonephila clavipes]
MTKAKQAAGEKKRSVSGMFLRPPSRNVPWKRREMAPLNGAISSNMFFEISGKRVYFQRVSAAFGDYLHEDSTKDF